jgi:hypothetical protein
VKHGRAAAHLRSRDSGLRWCAALARPGEDGVPSHVVEHAFGEAVAEGAKKLREQFTALKPERNHDLMEALQRAYLQSQLQLVLPSAESQGVEARAVLKAARVPDWAMGRTCTIHYLASQLPNHTTLLVTAGQVQLRDAWLQRHGEP